MSLQKIPALIVCAVLLSVAKMLNDVDFPIGIEFINNDEPNIADENIAHGENLKTLGIARRNEITDIIL